jgi:hypothetical protein
MTSGLFTRGFSEAARYVENETQEQRRRLQESNAFGIESTLREELGEIWEQCRDPNWDGFGSLAVNNDTLRNTYVFLESLPLGTPGPSVGAEPDGSFTLEWHRSPRRTLSVSVSPDGDLHFAAIFGPSRVYGTEAFFGEIPDNILALIRRVCAA